MEIVKYNSGCFAFYPAKNPLEQKPFWGATAKKPQQLVEAKKDSGNCSFGLGYSKASVKIKTGVKMS